MFDRQAVRIFVEFKLLVKVRLVALRPCPRRLLLAFFFSLRVVFGKLIRIRTFSLVFSRFTRQRSI